MASLSARRLSWIVSGSPRYRHLFALYDKSYCSDGRSAGSIRDAGGAFGKKEKAQEDQYFKKLQDEQLKKLHELKEFHHEELKHHQEAIERHEEKIKEFKKKIKADD